MKLDSLQALYDASSDTVFFVALTVLFTIVIAANVFEWIYGRKYLKEEADRQLLSECCNDTYVVDTCDQNLFTGIYTGLCKRCRNWSEFTWR